MKKCLAFLLLFCHWSFSGDITTEPEEFQNAPPGFCMEGAVTEGSVEIGVSCDSGSCGDDVDFDAELDFLKAVAPNHIAINSNVTVKGDGAFYFSDGHKIYFYDSIGGYRGSDNANLEGNAYLNYKFSEVLRFGPQQGWIWVMKNIKKEFPWCSKKKVYFQHMPTVKTTVSSYLEPGRITGTIYFTGYQDLNFSRNAIEGKPIVYDVQRKVISKWTGKFCDVVEDSTSWQILRNLSSTSTLSFSNIDCEVRYRIRSYDGALYSAWSYYTAENPYSNHIGGSSSGSSSSSGGSTSSSGGGTCVRRCSIEP